MKRRILTILGILLLLTVAVVGFFVFADYSDGCRVGNVLKISRKGVVFKTFEGQLDLGVYQGTTPKYGNVVNTVWDFSVTDPAVVAAIEKSVDEGRRVKLCYKEKYYQFDWIGDTKYIVYKVEEVGAHQEPNNTPPPAQPNLNTPPTQQTVTQ
ncbi:MAG: hypothetical protein KA974_02060 [Saprospiraceae bacterium]|nr:hypothetical protein [Saprospiraceae bacterium]MBP7679763.1 hypothetical protein [Saprospiraceae bacterium]